MIKESCNLIAREYFILYLVNQNFFRYVVIAENYHTISNFIIFQFVNPNLMTYFYKKGPKPPVLGHF